MTRKAASFAIKSGYITAQVGVGAFDGVGLCFSRCDIVTRHPFALSINQFVVSGKAVAVKLMHLRYQRKDLIDQGLHGVPGALLHYVKGEDRARFAIHDGGDVKPAGSVLFVFFSPVFGFFLARLALQNV